MYRIAKGNTCWSSLKKSFADADDALVICLCIARRVCTSMAVMMYRLTPYLNSSTVSICTRCPGWSVGCPALRNFFRFCLVLLVWVPFCSTGSFPYSRKSLSILPMVETEGALIPHLIHCTFRSGAIFSFPILGCSLRMAMRYSVIRQWVSRLLFCFGTRFFGFRAVILPPASSTTLFHRYKVDRDTL